MITTAIREDLEKPLPISGESLYVNRCGLWPLGLRFGWKMLRDVIYILSKFLH